LIDLNAGQAALRAGYGGGNIAAARVTGHRLRRRPQIADAISKALAGRTGATHSRIIEEISPLAFSNVADVLTVEGGQLVVKEHAELDRDTLATIAEVSEVINDKGHRTLRVKQHDRLQALQLLARIMGMLINRQEVSGPGGKPVEVERRDHRANIMARFEAMANRLPAPREQPVVIDVTPQKASPSALLAARLREDGERE
jgi:Terminase small subunit